ncbi:MAG: ABC transporter permease [Phycisphaerales bacterium]|nr:ABC transporter permease [Phycisphaerales bacterium]
MNFVEKMGANALTAVEALGAYVRFVGNILYWTFRGPGRFARRQLILQMFEIGTLSIPVVMITGAFIGAVLAIEMLPQFQSLGLAGRIGSVINISVIKQIGPVLTAVMLAGRVGGALTAELGTMRVTEQIDALRAMATDPTRALAVPRFVACLIMTPILTVFSNAMGMAGGWIMAVKINAVDNTEYWLYTQQVLDFYTLNTGFIKAFFFGAAIASIACYKGFNCGPGAQGVGRACTEAFVASFISILVINFFIAMLLNTIYLHLWPGAGSMI